MLEARNLISRSFSGRCNAFCAIRFENQVFRTQVIRNSREPHWNESFTLYLLFPYVFFSFFLQIPFLVRFLVLPLIICYLLLLLILITCYLNVSIVSSLNYVFITFYSLYRNSYYSIIYFSG